MIRLALAFVAAQLLDLGTASPLTEINPAVVALGTHAPLVKVALVASVLIVAALLARTHQRPVGVLVLIAGVAVGCVGAVSNVTAR